MRRRPTECSSAKSPDFNRQYVITNQSPPKRTGAVQNRRSFFIYYLINRIITWRSGLAKNRRRVTGITPHREEKRISIGLPPPPPAVGADALWRAPC